MCRLRALLVLFVVAAAGALLLGLSACASVPSPFRPRDVDGDGILPDQDRCPDAPEDYDGFEDEDGCPDPDNDKDGVLDIDDKCPNEAGPARSQGCPTTDHDDRDGDGIPDARDKCVDDPEDRDGFEDDDGCPDPDNDKDGVPDKTDQCPNTPGPPENHGCPREHRG